MKEKICPFREEKNESFVCGIAAELFVCVRTVTKETCRFCRMAKLVSKGLLCEKLTPLVYILKTEEGPREYGLRGLCLFRIELEKRPRAFDPEKMCRGCPEFSPLEF